MTADPIFNAVASTEIIWAEIYRLVATLPDAFSPDLVLCDWTEEGLEDDWAGRRTGFHFEVTKAVKGQRLPSQLLFVFDLARPESPTSWPQARKAILTCAYEPKFGDRWGVDQVVIGMDGQLISKDSRDNCTQLANGRLIVWDQNELPWHQQAWFFSVLLRDIQNREALLKEVVSPIKGLLLSDLPVESVFDQTSAIRFTDISTSSI
ncbi:hypothetical protein [Qipengyuania spongiae]|uniref:Uncharacterized protein n=1 Tax=Qipengyuania spongiae TaxID=2909673 RepID=A0ABY5SX59_9SPHN|nr:hypothetical protein [Qipengyuania spongiae]UVI38804.1 hypothetical protein L1F33_11190 [Qipengyuania spongiae]